ncbi:hypothetical protein BJ508DRAFT_375891 [Ascobolus immersus RN42]|uniref:Uncharacterized protein n=1 Tax=Ascobolus immersus RN42 TaxID=1160509 RepID=A0A3N4I7Z2_ASCIM|nr:hypothetical protein BJ508DRAFT_375891 [Ascobolus immersus RN42]
MASYAQSAGLPACVIGTNRVDRVHLHTFENTVQVCSRPRIAVVLWDNAVEEGMVSPTPGLCAVALHNFSTRRQHWDKQGGRGKDTCFQQKDPAFDPCAMDDRIKSISQFTLSKRLVAVFAAYGQKPARQLPKRTCSAAIQDPIASLKRPIMMQ